MMAVDLQEGGWTMARTAEKAAREAVIAELKRLITAGTYETLEKLEDAVDSFLWSEQDRLHAECFSAPRESRYANLREPRMSVSRELERSHPR
jgi:hypothetical protein